MAAVNGRTTWAWHPLCCRAACSRPPASCAGRWPWL